MQPSQGIYIQRLKSKSKPYLMASYHLALPFIESSVFCYYLGEEGGSMKHEAGTPPENV